MSIVNMTWLLGKFTTAVRNFITKFKVPALSLWHSTGNCNPC